jgi:hypothetical protein
VPDFGDIWPTLYVASDAVRHTLDAPQRVRADHVTGYECGDSDPNDLQTFEGLAQHILIWNSTAITAAEIKAYVAHTEPHVTAGADASDSIFNPAGGRAALTAIENDVDRGQAIEGLEHHLGVGVTASYYLNSSDSALPLREVAKGVAFPFESTLTLHSFLNETVRNYSYPYNEDQQADERWQYDSNDINSESRTFSTGRFEEPVVRDASGKVVRKAQVRNADRWLLLRQSQYSVAARASTEYTDAYTNARDEFPE